MPQSSTQPTGVTIRAIQTELRRLVQRLQQVNDSAGTHIDLHATDLAVLDLLDRLGPLSPRSICDELGIHPATLTGVLDRLEQGHWVERLPDPDDRRRVRVEPKGERRAELLRLYAPLNRGLADLCATYSGDQLETVLDFLTRAADAGSRALTEMDLDQP